MKLFSGNLPYQEHVSNNGTLIEIKRRGPYDIYNMDHKAILVFLVLMCTMSAMFLLRELFQLFMHVPLSLNTRTLFFNTFTFFVIVIPPLALYFWKQNIRIYLGSLDVVLQIFLFKKRISLSEISTVRIMYSEVRQKYGLIRCLWEVSIQVNQRNVVIVRYNKEEEIIALKLAEFLSKKLNKPIDYVKKTLPANVNLGILKKLSSDCILLEIKRRVPIGRQLEFSHVCFAISFVCFIFSVLLIAVAVYESVFSIYHLFEIQKNSEGVFDILYYTLTGRLLLAAILGIPWLILRRPIRIWIDQKNIAIKRILKKHIYPRKKITHIQVKAIYDEIYNKYSRGKIRGKLYWYVFIMADSYPIFINKYYDAADANQVAKLINKNLGMKESDIIEGDFFDKIQAIIDFES